jgi:hypothetical protein
MTSTLRSHRSLRQFFTLFSLFAFVLATSLFSQSNSGDVTGTVSDPSGAAVAGALVTALNEATGVKTTATANGEGTYRFTNLPIGSYTVTASAANFTAAALKGVAVDLNKIVTANLTLAVGAASTTVEVTAAGAGIDTTTAQIETTFSTSQVANLPTAATGSGIYNLTLLGAGVASSGGVGQGFGPSVSGQRPDNNVFMIDGVSNQNMYNPAPLLTVSNDAIAELSLLQNQFAPEFGSGSGGIFNTIVKSGTNEIHGSIYEYLQNRSLNAIDQLQAVQGAILRGGASRPGYTAFPRYDNNRLGATIGGPIVKNKLFYFGNFEYNPIGQSTTPGTPITAPTAAGYSVIAGFASKITPNNLNTFQKYVGTAPANDAGSICVFCPVVNGKQVPNVPIGNISVLSPSYSNGYNAVVSIDYNMSDKDQLRGRWIYNKFSGIDTGAQLPIFDVQAPNNNYFYSLSEFHNFSPTIQNEFRSSFSRNNQTLPVPNITFPGLTVFPVITIDDLNSVTLGPDGPSGSIQNLFQLQDNVSIVKGNHTIKFGYHFTDVILTNFFIQRVLGNYEYSTFALYLQDLSPDVLGERSAGATSYPLGFLQNTAFVGDDWKIRPNLTVNLGLNYEYVTMPVASRYQVYSDPANVPGVFTVPNPQFSKNNWAPRIGFAYAPGKSGDWAIRGGFAMAYDNTYSNLNANAAPPYFQQTNDVNENVQTPNFLAGGGLPGSAKPLPSTQAGALGVLGSLTYGGPRPYGITWDIGVQKVFHKDYTFEARYVGTRGVHLWTQTQLNYNPLVSASNYIPTYFSVPSLATLASEPKTLGQVESFIVPGGTAGNPYNSLAAYGSAAKMTGYNPEATSTYHGLALQLNRRLANGLNLIVAYTWSHLLDDATATNFSTYLTPRRSQNWQNIKQDWSSSALDRRQRFTLTPVYDWQPFKGGNWFLKNLVGNWSVSGTYTYQSPEYATVQSGIDSNLNNDTAGDRTIINPAGAATAGTGVTGYNAQGQAVAAGSPSIVAYVANSANARYVVAGLGALANAGRNTFPLKPTDNIDAGLSKRFTIREGMRLSFGGQFYNLFNHAQYTGGYLSDVQANSYTTSRNDLVPTSASFGNFSQYYSSNSRKIQVNAKIDF